MHETIKDKCKLIIILAVVFSLLSMTLTGCKSSEKIFTIGIASHVSIHTKEIEGFKAGMAELGYIEGNNIRYVYKSDISFNDKDIEAGIKELLAQDIDLLFTTYNESALAARKAVEGTKIPVIVTAVSWPVEIGLVNSLSHPGGNVTGIQVTDTITKGLEWLAQITPHAKKIYLPYNPDDNISDLYLDILKKTASKLGIELVVQKIHSVEETVAAIENLPKDVDAIYRIPSPTLYPRNNELSQAAIKRGIPLGAGTALDESVLITFSIDFYSMGKQGARLAHEILKGAKPADLPIETADILLTINLRTAEKIGLHIPEDVLVQANKIIR
jgi:putative tryptophan/tyrosine transport system substrate-binding protein